MVENLRTKLPRLAQLLALDLQAAMTNDPAASGYEEILLSYPGIEAITVQRLAHELYLLKVPYLPRMMTEIAHSRPASIFIPERQLTNLSLSIMERAWSLAKRPPSVRTSRSIMV